MQPSSIRHGRWRRAAFCLTALFAGLSAWGSPPAVAGDVRPIAEIKSLGDSETRSRPRAAIRGVVTWREERSRTMFVQDATAGIYVVFPRNKPDERLPDGVQLAAEVVAEGVVSPGGFASSIALESVRVIGPASLPEPRQFDDHRFFTGADDGLFVEATGLLEAEIPGRGTAGRDDERHTHGGDARGQS